MKKKCSEEAGAVSSVGTGKDFFSYKGWLLPYIVLSCANIYLTFIVLQLFYGMLE